MMENLFFISGINDSDQPGTYAVEYELIQPENVELIVNGQTMDLEDPRLQTREFNVQSPETVRKFLNRFMTSQSDTLTSDSLFNARPAGNDPMARRLIRYHVNRRIAAQPLPSANIVTGTHNWFVAYINVGRGDSTLIRCPRGKYYLIDCGDINQRVDQKLMLVFNQIENMITPPFTPRELSGIFLSHPDNDHYRGILNVIRYWGRTNDCFLYLNDQTMGPQAWQITRNEIEPMFRQGNYRLFGIPPFQDRQNLNGLLPNLRFEFHWPHLNLRFMPNQAGNGPFVDRNESSHMLTISGERHQFLFNFFGDAETVAWRHFFNLPGILPRVTGDLFFKYSHHGRISGNPRIQALGTTVNEHIVGRLGCDSLVSTSALRPNLCPTSHGSHFTDQSQVATILEVNGNQIQAIIRI